MQDDPSPTRTRLVIADDHPLYRIALRQILCEQSNLEVVGEAGDGNEALELCRRLRPDIVLMDVRMPELDGIEATRVIKQEMPRTIVLIVTSFEDRDYLLESLKAGAAGYILKGATSEEIIEAIQQVLSGESPLNQGLAAQLLRHLIESMKEEGTVRRDLSEGFPEETTESFPPGLLTPRETEVLRLLALGWTNRQIAQELSIALSTVKNHVQHIIAKLDVSDRTQASVRAVELGLFPAEQDEK
jgi:DNA-binding NarL/FixJ family response regulator